MKKIFSFVLAVIMTLTFGVIFLSCLEPNEGDPSGAGGADTSGSDTQDTVDLTGISFLDGEFTYDGSPHSIFISGTLGEGVTVNYENNGKKDAGEYNVKAVFSKSGFKDAALTATLKIAPSKIESYTILGNGTVYDGYVKYLTISDLPAGVTASCTNDIQKNAGTYPVSVTLSGKNYETKTFQVNFTIFPAVFPSQLTFSDKFVKYDGQSHTFEVEGQYFKPAGTTISYQCENAIVSDSGITVTEPGTYNVTVTISNPNYQGRVLNKIVVVSQHDVLTGGYGIDIKGITLGAYTDLLGNKTYMGLLLELDFTNLTDSNQHTLDTDFQNGTINSSIVRYGGYSYGNDEWSYFMYIQPPNIVGAGGEGNIGGFYVSPGDSVKVYILIYYEVYLSAIDTWLAKPYSLVFKYSNVPIINQTVTNPTVSIGYFSSIFSTFTLPLC